MAERGVSVDHVTIWRWVDRFAPELERRLRHHLQPRIPVWRVDETYIRVGGEVDVPVSGRGWPRSNRRFLLVGNAGCAISEVVPAQGA